MAEHRPVATTAGPDAGIDAAGADGARRQVRESYGRYHERVEVSEHASHIRFMNYGWIPIGDEPGEGRLTVPPLLPNREAALLVSEVVGPTPLAGAVVVDVGCGRGGALWLLARQDPPRIALGLDLAPAAVRATVAQIGGAGGRGAAVADAERLPVASGAVDVVVNIESSLHYPCIEQFYAEVARVLRPGGTFCYTDAMVADDLDAYRAALDHSGLTIEVERDITPNVLAARRRRGDRQQEALAGADERDAARFVGAPGSDFFTAMHDGTLSYRLLRLRRDDRPARPAPPDPRLRAAAARAASLLGGFDAR